MWRSKRNLILLLLSYAAIISGVSTLGYFYFDLNDQYKGLANRYNTLLGMHTDLVIEYNSLLIDYLGLIDEYNELLNNYTNLFGNYTNLFGSYNELSNEHNELSGNYNSLTNDYNELSGNYNNLLDDYSGLGQSYSGLLNSYNILYGTYQSVLDTLENPLTNPTIPTISEVAIWLYYDNTDFHNYTEYWMCGDFSAMLMTRAKEMNWRMRIACMFFSFSGDLGYGDNTDPYGAYGHAFNAIYVQDGDDDDEELDLYYIEPQTDTIWWLNYSGNHLEYNIWSYWSGDMSGTVFSEGYYVNHYSIFD